MSKINNKILGIVSAIMLLSASLDIYAQNNPMIIIDNHGRPILIYNNPCTNKPYNVSPGVKVYPSPLIGSNCDENNEQQSEEINPMIYPPIYPYIPVPKTKEDAIGGVGLGLGYGVGRLLK